MGNSTKGRLLVESHTEPATEACYICGLKGDLLVTTYANAGIFYQDLNRYHTVGICAECSTTIISYSFTKR